MKRVLDILKLENMFEGMALIDLKIYLEETQTTVC